MIFKYIRNKINPPTKVVNTSKYWPYIFHLNKQVSIDESFGLLIKQSVVKLPKYVTPVAFATWTINNDADEFEEIILSDKSYKFLYDPTNDILYLLQLSDISKREDINLPNIVVDGIEYEQVTDVIEVDNENRLIRIYERELTQDNNEYLFLETDSKMLQKTWIGVTIETSAIR